MSLYPESVISEINALVDINRLLQLIDYKTNKLQDGPETIKGFCPIHKESVFRTLIVDKTNRTFRCMYSLCEGSEGGSLVRLYALAKRQEEDEAVKELIRLFGLNVNITIDEEFLAKNLDIAENYRRIGELDEAERLLSELLALRPDCVEAHEGLLKVFSDSSNTEGLIQARQALARLHAANGRWDDAKTQAKAWAELDTENPEPAAILAECAMAAGDIEGALYEFMAVADQREAAGDYDGALAAYARVEKLQEELGNELVDLHPLVVRTLQGANRRGEAVEYLLSRGQRALDADKFARAAEFFAAAMEVDTGNLELRKKFLEIAPKAGNISGLTSRVLAAVDFIAAHHEEDAAIAALEQFVQVAPDDPVALAKLMDLYYAQGMNVEGADVEVRLAKLMVLDGYAPQAQARLIRILEWQPEHSGTLEALAEIDDALGNKAGVRSARRRLAKIYASRREYQQALDLITPYYETEPYALEIIEQMAVTLEGWARHGGPAEAMERAAGLYDTLADRLLEATSGNRAILFLERAAGLSAKPAPERLLKLATFYRRAGQLENARDAVIRGCEALAAGDHLDEAILEAEQFLELLPGDLDLVRYLAELYLRFGDSDAATKRLRTAAQGQLAAGNDLEAEEMFEQALQLVPDDFVTLEAMAEVYRSRNDLLRYCETLERAADIYETRCDLGGAIAPLEALVAVRATDLHSVERLIDFNDALKRPDDARRWRIHLAGVYRDSGDRALEAEIIGDLLRADPSDMEALAMLESCEYETGNIAAGIRHARRRAQLLIEEGHAELARRTLEEAAHRSPTNIDVARDLFLLLREDADPEAPRRGIALAEMLVAAGDPAEATVAFEEAAACEPANVELRRAQVEFLRRNGRTEDVAAARLSLARTLQRHERYIEAEQVLKQILDANEDDSAAREELVELYCRVGDSEKVEEHLITLAEGFEQAGEDEKSIEMLRRLLAQNGDSVRARRMLVARYRDQNRPAEAAHELHQLATAYRSHGPSAEADALDAERLAVEIHPDDPMGRRRLVNSLREAGHTLEAADELERLAAIHMEFDEFEEAEAALDGLLTLDPARVSARRLRGELYERQGDVQSALEEYRMVSEVLIASGVDPTASGIAANGVGSGQTSGSVGNRNRVRGLPLVREYDFDHFVVGSANEFAHATCLAIARAPGQQYNPLFLHSNVGLGKTHLVNAIANVVLARTPDASVIYTSSEAFTTELVESIQNNNVNEFRARYRDVDLLIVDDVHFLAGKERAQEEFFHIFNALYQAKKQIIVTSDRRPSEIAHLEARLRSRFGSGVIVDISGPDLETRVAILNKEAQSAELGLNSQLIQLIAEHIDTNVRDMKAALNQLVAQSVLRGIAPTMDSVSSMLSSLYAKSA